MNQKIIILSGKGNCGKTATVKLVYQQLLKKYPNAKEIFFKKVNDEIVAVLNIDGKIVGISSQGDAEHLVAEHLKTLVDEGCSIILTATRTSGGTIGAVNSYCPPFEKIQYGQKYVDKKKQTSSNQKMAKEIVLFISNEINT